MNISFGFGQSTVQLNIPDKNLLKVLEANPIQMIGDESEIVQKALQNPIQSRRLNEIVRKGEKIAIITSDITRPMPSMPVAFWNDPHRTAYESAYFDTFPGVWRHGDSITVTDRGTVVIHGRSDSTLNRQGVRLGSAEIYAAVELLPDVLDSLVVGVEQPDGGYWMPMFVVPTDIASSEAGRTSARSTSQSATSSLIIPGRPRR